ncbi:MAG: hypothetical protein R3D03_10300 [Geminicoccaceae bacterium]
MSDDRAAKAAAVRRRLKDDFSFYCRKALKIRTKDGDILPFELNKAQRHLLGVIERQMEQRGYVRVVILKGRQQGLSTLVTARLYHQTTHRKGAKSLVMAHKADSSAALFTMTRRYHDHCPDALKPSTKYSSKRELVFDVLDSAFTVATAGGDAVARGETFTSVHASEQAFWPKSSARDIWNGIAQSVPKSRGTEVYIESTANGVSGLFYEMWKKAVAGENEYEAVFIPWFWEDGYSVDPPADFRLLPEEVEIRDRHGLTPGNLYWRRLKIGETSLEQFQQEYPLEPTEAFLTSGLPAFDSGQLARMLDECPGELELDRRGWFNGEWETNPRGPLIVHEEPRAGEQYVIGADVSKGIRGADWSVAQVLDRDHRLVATYRAHVLPDHFAQVLDSLGHLYNTAELLVEANDHGVLTNFVLSRDFQYPNLYTATRHDKTDDQETTTVGFVTNARTRPLILDQLRSDVRSGKLSIRDRQTINEMLTFVANTSGKLVAEEGSHDDCVMALAIANYGLSQVWTPIRVPESVYLTAI